MTGRARLLAAFRPDGASEFGVVACYEGIFIRDHYAAITRAPWWDPMAKSAVARDYAAASGLDWFCVDACASREERARQRVVQRADGVWRIDLGSGKETRLAAPASGGTNSACASSKHTDTDALPASTNAVDALVPLAAPFDRDRFQAEGRHEAAAAIREATDLFLYSHITSPVWSFYNRLGYEGMMLLLAQNPDLAAYMGQRVLHNTLQRIRMVAALGAEAVWIEECLTDQINPGLFTRVNLPLVRQCVNEIRACGMKSLYYYCGNPHDRLEAIVDAGADAIHLEESKKDFAIDIAEIVARVKGRCVVFGNLDAIGVLQNGTDDLLRREIARQVEAGRTNGGRFVMSTGSPITPETPVERVRRYADLVREARS